MDTTIQPRPRRRRSHLAVIAIALAGASLAVLGVALGLAVAGDDQSAATAPRLSDVRQSCQMWMTSADPAGDPSWCVGMTDWMTDQMGAGPMGPQMMWGNATRLAQSCRRWMGADPSASTVGAETWCDEMVTWIDEHMTGWPGWATSGPMMGG